MRIERSKRQKNCRYQIIDWKRNYLKKHLEIMQEDSTEFAKKAKVDVNSGESFYKVQFNNLGKSLWRCLD